MATHTGVRLMAPVLPRQFHQFPSPPRPPKEIPGTPVPVTRFISVKVFLELFAGTICIFVLGVLFWKMGQCFRVFTRGKVLREGKSTETRYARTWYGWVPLHRHEAAKDVFRKCWGKLCEWTAWKTTRADYSWVWWDPGQKAHEEYHQKRSLLRWLPKCLRSKSFTTADTIWNNGPLGRHGDNSRDRQPAEMTGAVPCHAQAYHMSADPYTWPKRRNHRRRRFEQGTIRSNFQRRRESSVHNSHLPFRKNGQFWSLHQSNHTPRKNIPFLDALECVPELHPSPSLPCLPMVKQRQFERPNTTRKPFSTTEIYFTPETLRKVRYSRKYQVWSARIQLRTSNQVRHNHHGLQEPPGTPMSELLASYASENSAPLGSFGRMRGSVEHSLSDTSSRGVPSLRNHHFARTAMSTIAQNKGLEMNKWSTMPVSGSTHHPLPSSNVFAPKRWSASLRDRSSGKSFLLPENLMSSETKGTKGKDPARKHLRHKKPKRSPLPFEDLSNWETRWVDNLDRKLEWNLDQLTPGRRPFHFPLLANHWLNKRTWMVIDPVSRVPLENKRQWGDPRFNVPYPVSRWEPKPRYPTVVHRTAYKPQIDSWRGAVNRQRRTSGIIDVVKIVELFDDSVDEPPDGMIDPACWVLRKPPQGFGISTEQRNAYYEGGAGWQEKLNDWQRIRRGYRIRKVIHEGRVNRTRAKEVAIGMSRLCRTAVSKAAKTVMR